MVDLIDETHRFPAPERLRAAVAALLADLGEADRDVTVVLMEDEAVAHRNRQDRGVEGPTDVLSYPTHEPTDVGMPAVAHLGDVLVALGVAERQAEAHGHDLVTEVLHLASHGVTHLRGFDHPTEAAWAPFHHAAARIAALDAGRPQDGSGGTP